MERTKYPTLEPELALASDLAKKAGHAILAVRANAIASSSLKSDESSVTAADAVIRAGLAATGDAIVTEETWKDGDIGKHPRVWFVDPIDGIEDFIKKSREYVGLCVHGAPALGVVYQPETGLLWRGVVADRRCERVEAGGALPRTVAGRALLAKPRMAISVLHPSAVVDFVMQEFGGVSVWRGSAGLKVALIVDDEADAYVTASRRIKLWDTCAPAAVLLAAGGAVTTLAGAPVPTEKSVLIARVDVAVDEWLRFWAMMSVVLAVPTRKSIWPPIINIQPRDLNVRAHRHSLCGLADADIVVRSLLRNAERRCSCEVLGWPRLRARSADCVRCCRTFCPDASARAR
jgi:3'(2'), 5'-bisphosphate nucleotidase